MRVIFDSPSIILPENVGSHHLILIKKRGSKNYCGFVNYNHSYSRYEFKKDISTDVVQHHNDIKDLLKWLHAKNYEIYAF